MAIAIALLGFIDLGHSGPLLFFPETSFIYNYLHTVQKCAVPENIHTPPHRRDWNFLGGEWFYKAKKFKDLYEA